MSLPRPTCSCLALMASCEPRTLRIATSTLPRPLTPPAPPPALRLQQGSPAGQPSRPAAAAHQAPLVHRSTRGRHTRRGPPWPAATSSSSGGCSGGCSRCSSRSSRCRAQPPRRRLVEQGVELVELQIVARTVAADVARHSRVADGTAPPPARRQRGQRLVVRGLVGCGTAAWGGGEGGGMRRCGRQQPQ
jgi:hypothetical protein